MGGSNATNANNTANSQYTDWEQSALNGYNSDIGNYMSNVNSALAAGNPYQSKSYLTNQNLDTSAAMNSANTAATQALKQNAARTGENGASTQATIASNARQGQRDLTAYNAQTATNNEDKYLNYEQGLMQDQLAGANSEAGVYGTSVSGRSNSLGNLTNIQDSEDQMWGNIIGSAAGAAGAGIGAANR